MKNAFPKKVLVTGAEGALGHAVVERFLKEGSEVIGTWFSKSDKEKKDTKRIHWVNVDLGNPKEVEEAFRNANFDAVIHCAGGFRYSEVTQLSDSDFDFLIQTNLRSGFYL